MRGYFRIKLDGCASYLASNSNKRTGEGRLAVVEKELRRQGIEFVEDFAEENIVIVRYGDYLDDAVFDRAMGRNEVLIEEEKEEVLV